MAVAVLEGLGADAIGFNLSLIHISISRNLASVRCFYKFLIFRGMTDCNPAKGIKLEKTAKKLPQVLSGEEIELLLTQPDITEPKGCRDKAMLELLYATGTVSYTHLDVYKRQRQGRCWLCG